MHEPHAAYVVTAYAVSSVVLAALVIDTLWRARRWKQAAAERERNRAP